MRLVTYLPPGSPGDGTSFALRGLGRTGAVVDVEGTDVVLDLHTASGGEIPRRMLRLIGAGSRIRDRARRLAERAAGDGTAAAIADADGLVAGDDGPLGAPLARSRLLAPLPDPPSLRDFYAFEDHVRRGFAKRGEPVPDPWFELPVYYLTNHRSILGPGEEIPWPAFTDELDYELELAMVVGRPGRGLSVAEAADHVFGYTLYNDCSARDLQRREMQVRLGPARSKGFAQVLGPCIVTPDEIDPADLRVTATIDGQVVTDSRTRDMRFSFAEMLAYVSVGEDVFPGDVYGSGTVGDGCGLEHGRMLRPGETIALSAPRIGTLANPVGHPAGGDRRGG